MVKSMTQNFNSLEIEALNDKISFSFFFSSDYNMCIQERRMGVFWREITWKTYAHHRVWV